MNHDALFKEMLQNFLPEFLRLFFPNEASQLDLDSIRFLNPEAIADFPDGQVRRADVIAEVRTLAGEIELILIHIEVQAKRNGDVPFRVWEYYHVFRSRYRIPVFPIVLYLSPGAGGLAVERYNETVLGRPTLTFEYAVVGLSDLRAEPYEASDDPLAVALASLMRSPRNADKLERKHRSLTRVTRGRMDPARKLLLATIIKRYQRLPADQEKTLFERLQREEGANETMSIYELIREEAKEEFLKQGIEQGIARGIQEGVEQGIRRGQQEALLRQLAAKFGALPDDVKRRIEGVSDHETLDGLLTRVLTASSLDEMGIPDAGAA